MRRCLVLGGGGFLGGHIVEALAADGLTVRVFDRTARRADLDASIEWVEGDFGNRGDVSQAVAGCDAAIHLVATTLPKTSNDDPIHDLESNLLPTVRFLDSARQHGLRRVVFASSGGTVYGLPTQVPITETHATRPLCSYGIHKLAIEQYLHLYHGLHDSRYCVLRVSNPFGERQRPDGSQGAVAVFVDRALRDHEITIWGDGSAIRDYVYVGDVARAFALAVSRRDATGVFNIGSGQGHSLLDLLTAIERQIGRPVARRFMPARAFDVPVNILDARLAARELGWTPDVPFEAGLQRTTAHLESLALPGFGNRLRREARVTLLTQLQRARRAGGRWLDRHSNLRNTRAIAMTQLLDEYRPICDEFAREVGVLPNVHPEDFIFRFLIDNPVFTQKRDAIGYYFNDGAKSARRLKALLADVCEFGEKPIDLLEFASGFGCVTRHLKGAMPNVETTSCDIHPDAIRFIRETLGATALQSASVPEDLRPGKQFDAVFALSFFSHMPKRSYARWMEKLASLTKSGGFLLFTAHGHVSRDRHLTQCQLDEEEFYFHPSSEQKDSRCRRVRHDHLRRALCARPGARYAESAAALLP